MTAYERWDIILVPFPFTDLQSIKKRPALIVSPDEYNRGSDVMIAFITSNLNLRYNHGDYKLLYWKKAGLPKPSMIRMKIATIDKRITIKNIGKLDKYDADNFRTLIINFFS